MRARRVIILGSTGSIGTQTLEVIAHLNGLHAAGRCEQRFEVVGLACGKNAALMAQQAEKFGVRHTACAAVPESAAESLAFVRPSCGDALSAAGEESASDLVSSVECDMVVAAVVGSAGIQATLKAVELGRDVALANKETLVAAGSLVVAAAKKSGAALLPVDSEHAALWQCLGSRQAPPSIPDDGLERVILTASGGPFRTWTKEKIWGATAAEALRHPTWTMGRKVTVDSASLMNKALEIIEAHWLFGIPGSRIEALVHPQSLVHAIAEFRDGNCMAQLAAPDMRTPIQHALTWPRRVEGLSRRLEWSTLRGIEFEPVDHERFPLLALAHRAISDGGTAGAILNGANEAAVGAFLRDGSSLRFGAVVEAVLETVSAVRPSAMRTLDDCMNADAAAREHACRVLKVTSPE